MHIFGIDFTSRPMRSKPITCMECVIEGTHLRARRLTEWRDFAGFEAALRRPGPWIAGIDFPFGQSRRFIETIGWPDTWPRYVDHVSRLGRQGFRATLDAYRKDRNPGDKEHRLTTIKKVTSGSTPEVATFIDAVYASIEDCVETALRGKICRKESPWSKK